MSGAASRTSGWGSWQSSSPLPASLSAQPSVRQRKGGHSDGPRWTWGRRGRLPGARLGGHRGSTRGLPSVGRGLNLALELDVIPSYFWPAGLPRWGRGMRRTLLGGGQGLHAPGSFLVLLERGSGGRGSGRAHAAHEGDGEREHGEEHGE